MSEGKWQDGHYVMVLHSLVPDQRCMGDRRSHYGEISSERAHAVIADEHTDVVEHLRGTFCVFHPPSGLFDLPAKRIFFGGPLSHKACVIPFEGDAALDYSLAF